MRALTSRRRPEALSVLSGRSSGAASVAAVELGVDEERRCPRCDTPGAVSRGRARGLRRYRCKGCGRTFNAVTGAPLSGLHRKDRWLSFGEALATGETVKASAERCGVAVGTAFRWRHRFLKAVATAPDKLKGIVEADETYVLESRKGERTLKRKARRRGGKASKRGLSREQVPVLMAAARGGATVSAVLPAVTADALRNALEPAVAKDILLLSDAHRYPPCAAALGVRHEALNATAGERVRGPPAHSDGEQSPRPVQGFPPRLPRRRYPIPRQLPAMVPPRRLAPHTFPENMPRRSNRKSHAYESIIEPEVKIQGVNVRATRKPLLRVRFPAPAQ